MSDPRTWTLRSQAEQAQHLAVAIAPGLRAVREANLELLRAQYR